MKKLFLILVVSLCLVGCGCDEATKESYESRYWKSEEDGTISVYSSKYENCSYAPGAVIKIGEDGEITIERTRYAKYKLFSSDEWVIIDDSSD